MLKILESFANNVQNTPNKTAVHYEGKPITYKALNTQIEKYCDLLANSGVNNLGVYLDNSPEWIALDIAALKMEIPVIAIPHFFSNQQKTHIVKDVGLECIISSNSDNDSWLAQQGTPQLFTNDLLIVRPLLSVSSNPYIPMGTAKITYTSGSTGTPKGVCLSAKLIDDTTTSLLSAINGLPIDNHLSLLPFSTLLENIAGIYLPIRSNVTIHCASRTTLGMLPSLQVDPAKFATAYNFIRPSSLIVTPQLLQLLCGLLSAKLIDCSKLAFIAVGGASCSTLLLSRAKDLGLPVYQGYGLSECGSVVALSTPSANKLGACGKPLEHIQVMISDTQEVLLSGNQFGCYLGDTGTFPSAISTGDVGSIDSDGFLHIDGRDKNRMVLSTGRNVSPEWVESELQQQAEIAQSLVYGDGDSAASALIVASETKLTNAALSQAVTLTNLRLPLYAQIGTWQRVQPFTFEKHQLTTNGRPRREQIFADYQLNQPALPLSA